MQGYLRVIRTIALTLASLGAVGAWSSVSAQQSPSTDQSWTSSISSGFKKMGQAFSPQPATTKTKPTSGDDPVSLRTAAKPGANLYVAFARLAQDSRKFPEAEQQYQMALKEAPDHLPALLGYAELKEQIGQPDQAIKLYQRAIKVSPQQSPAYNNLGLCYARQGRFADAAATLDRAVQLTPKNPLYRNNLATVLVELGRNREAFAALREVHGDAVAYYNMGYLLNKKGHTQAAMQHFALALRADPRMEPAQRWVDYLQRQLAETRLAGHPAIQGTRITSDARRAAESQQYDRAGDEAGDDRSYPASARPREPMPDHWPNRAASRDPADGPTLPGISYDRPAAPLPPSGDYPAIRPLPRVE